MKVNIEGNISLASILVEIGFVDDGYALEFDFGNLLLRAVEGLNLSFMAGLHFTGIYQSKREVGYLNFSLPLKVESFEQGLAFLGYYLRGASVENRPIWLEEGIRLKDLLPWERERLLFKKIPKATIEHE